MHLKPIPRVPQLSRPALARYLADPKYPVVLTAVMRDWPAMKTWSFDFFAREFADFPVAAHAPQFPALAGWAVRARLADYIEYLRDPSAGHIEGTWLRGDPASLRVSGYTLYAGDFNPAHPTRGKPARVFEHVPRMPDFIDSWLDLLDPDFRAQCERLQSHHFVYLSVPGGITPLHHDFWDTHAFLAQITGVKHAILFDPQHMDALYTDETGDVRRMAKNPAFADIEGWSATLTPGDFLVIPARWLHYVETTEPSITYSADWIDGANWREYTSLATAALRERAARR